MSKMQEHHPGAHTHARRRDEGVARGRTRTLCQERQPQQSLQGGNVGETLMNPLWNFHEPKPTTLQIYTAAGGDRDGAVSWSWSWFGSVRVL